MLEELESQKDQLSFKEFVDASHILFEELTITDKNLLIDYARRGRKNSQNLDTNFSFKVC